MSDKASQRGYSLPEVLIAAAIAAGIVAAASRSISGSLTLLAGAKSRAEVLTEAETISARLRAGMTEKDALRGLDGWQIERAPYVDREAPDREAFDRVSVYSTGKREFSFELLLPIEEQER